MTIFSLVAAHTFNDLETVAHLSNAATEVPDALPELSGVSGAVTLSTCNRVEVYADAPNGDVDAAAEQLLEKIAQATDLPLSEAARSFRVHEHDAAVRHLFEVSSGLKSAVVGEREIAGQVRRALTEAQNAGIATGGLTKLFEAASRTAKDVGTHTALGSAGRSVVSVALDLATELRAGTSIVGAERFWADANILMVGTGAYAGTTIAQLKARGAQHVAVHSSSGRAEQFVAERGGWAMALGGEAVQGAFAEADVLIGVSGGERQVTAQQLAELRRDATGPLTVLDLALTHDFDPAIADLPGVDVITLESVRMAAPGEQQASIASAQKLVDTAVDDYLAETKQRTAGDAIVALRSHILGVMDSEIEKIQHRHGCTAAAQEVELAMRRMVGQILHEPTVRARQMAAEQRLDEYEDALETLFGIDVAHDAAQRQAAKKKPHSEKAPADPAPADSTHTERRTSQRRSA